MSASTPSDRPRPRPRIAVPPPAPKTASSPPAPPISPLPVPQPHLQFTDLAGDAVEIQIEHAGQIYRLRRTKTDKLLLTK